MSWRGPGSSYSDQTKKLSLLSQRSPYSERLHAFKYLKQREFIAISLALLLEVTDDLSVKVVSSEM